MSNVLTVHLYGEKTHVVICVGKQKNRTFTLTITVNGSTRLGPVDSFSAPQEALDYAVSHYTGYPLSGSHVEGGKHDLDASAAKVFIKNVEGKDAKVFHRFLADLAAQYGISPSSEAEYRTSHDIWSKRGTLVEAAMAVNKLRNSQNQKT